MPAVRENNVDGTRELSAVIFSTRRGAERYLRVPWANVCIVISGKERQRDRLRAGVQRKVCQRVRCDLARWSTPLAEKHLHEQVWNACGNEPRPEVMRCEDRWQSIRLRL